MAMTTDEALGWMIVGLINQHFPHPDDPHDESDPLGDACCRINCGPCGALHWFTGAGHRRDDLERLIRLTRFHVGGWCYWDDTTDSLRWDWFDAYWRRHKACAISDGVLVPCTTFQDDNGED